MGAIGKLLDEAFEPPLLHTSVEGELDIGEADDAMVEEKGASGLAIPSRAVVGEGEEWTPTSGLDPVVVCQLSMGRWDDFC